MASHDLKVEVREEKGKSVSRRLRYAGRLPAVVYGRKEEPIKLSVNAKEFRDFLSHHGSHGLFSLNVEGGEKTPAIIKALQRHPFKNHVQTIDFLRVSLSEKVTATVPVILTGEAVGVKVDGGVLVHTLHVIEISAFPQNLPESVQVDISELIFNGAPIHVHEIPEMQGVEFLTDGETPVAVVNPPELEEELEPVAEGEGAEAAAETVPAEHGSATTGGEAGDDSRSGTRDGKD